MKKKNNMIKFIKENKKIIYVSLVLLLLFLLILVIFLLFKNNNKHLYEKLNEQNKNMVVKDEYKEKPGTFIRSLDSLLKQHCKNDICIKNVIIYYIGTEGRIEYEITNNSKKKITGALKLKFDNDNSIYAVYNKLKKNETVKGSVSFTDLDFSNVYDYKLIAVKKDELKKLLKKK